MAGTATVCRDFHDCGKDVLTTCTIPSPYDRNAAPFAVPRNEGAKPGVASPCRDLSDVLSAVERADLAGHCHAAQGWAELQGRFMLSGFVLRADPSGPVLCLHPSRSPIGALAALGVDPGALAARFGRGLPSRADLAAT